MFLLILISLFGFSHSACQNATSNGTNEFTSGMRPGDKFFYFAYGSNLLADRIHINNPTAVRVSAAKLPGFRLDFGYWSERWKGAAATIVPDPDEHVWGAVWELDRTDIPNLDKQEGVEAGIYFPFPIEVEINTGEIRHCRTYRLCDTPVKLIPGEPVPEERRPSELYLRVIIKGAEESGIPEEYVDYLRHIPHNSYRGDNNTVLTSLISS